MTVKQHTPSGAQRSTSARTTNRPATPKRTVASDKKGSTKRPAKGKAEGKGLAEGAPDKAAIDYAQTAYKAALEHYYANQGHPLALSRLAVVYGEQKPGDFHMVVTLPGVLNDVVSLSDVYEAVRDAELFARTLEHPNCPESFKTAFEAIYTEHILDGWDVSHTTPAAVRVMLPLVLLEQWRHHDGRSISPTEILVTLSSELVPDEAAEEVRASMSLATKGGAK